MTRAQTLDRAAAQVDCIHSTSIVFTPLRTAHAEDYHLVNLPQGRPPCPGTVASSVRLWAFMGMVSATHAVSADQPLPGSAKPSDESAVEAAPVLLYRSPEERREAGLGRQLTPWLRFSGLLEAEVESEKLRFRGSSDVERVDDTTTALQVGLIWTLGKGTQIESVFEYEPDTRRSRIEEAFVAHETEAWGVEAGRLFVPFGEYYSHFVSDPLLEFGETSGISLIADFAMTERLDIAAYVIDVENGDRRRGASARTLGVALEWASEREDIKLGLGWLGDLGASDELRRAELEDLGGKRASGYNAYALIGRDRYEVTAEIVGALDRLEGVERAFDQPWAINLEWAYFPRPDAQLAVRYELSGELEDAPARRYGIAVSWLVGRHVNVALNYLYGKFKHDLNAEEGEAPDSETTVAAQISIEF